MGIQEWDDHDRSKKTLARDLAVDYLESCPPNAILFSFGDNDTYPLWYAQEVEGIRPDVRVMINTLLGTDWHINSLRYKINQADPVDPFFTKDQVIGDKKNIVYFTDRIPGWNKDTYYDLYDTFKTVLAADDPRYMTESEGGMPLNLLPTRKFSVPFDPQDARRPGFIKPSDHTVPHLHLDIDPAKNYLEKSDLTMLGIIAANKWKRPICFTSATEITGLGLGKYVRSRGLSYELVPVEDSRVDDDNAYHAVMTKFEYGHAGTPGVYFDEENRRRLNTIKFAHAEIAHGLIDAGRLADARRVLQHYDQNVSIDNFPYGMTSNLGNMDNRMSTYFLDACYASGDGALAAKVYASITKDLQQQMQYYQSLGEGMTDEQLVINAQQAMQGKDNNLSSRQQEFATDIISSYQLLVQIGQLKSRYNAVRGPASPPQ